MVQFDDLPTELSPLLGDTLMPPETRATIINGWEFMESGKRHTLIKKLHEERDPLERVLIAVLDTTKVLLTLPNEEVKITRI